MSLAITHESSAGFS